VVSGAFHFRAQAERMSHELKGLGPIEVKQAIVGSKPLFRVQLGPFDEVGAETTAKRMEELGITGGVHMLGE
jgi:hypothetical protein